MAQAVFPSHIGQEASIKPGYKLKLITSRTCYTVRKLGFMQTGVWGVPPKPLSHDEPPKAARRGKCAIL